MIADTVGSALKQVPNLLEPNHDEYLDLYLLRLAQFNGIPGLKDLLASVPAYGGQRSPASFIKELTQITGLEEAQLRQMCSKRGRADSPVNEKYLRMRLSPVCPLCIKEDGYSRLMWQHTYSTCCTKHGVRLVDQCTRCHSTIDTARPSVSHCKCALNLSSLPKEEVSKAELWFNKRLSGDLSPVDGMLDFGNTQSEQWTDLAELAEFFAGNLDQSVGRTTGNLPKPKTLAESVERLNSILPYFEDFPQRISSEVKARLAAAEYKHQTAEARLGYWVKRIFRICNDSQFHEFAQGLRDSVTDHADGLYYLTASVANVARSRYYNLAQGAKRLGTSSDRLLTLSEQGHVDMVEIRHSTLTGSRLFLKSYIDDLASTRAEAITKADAILLTGLSKKIVNYFMEYGLWEPNTEYAALFDQKRLVSKNRIDSLFESLELIREPRPANPVKLADFSLRRTTSQKSHRLLFEALAEGNLKPVNLKKPKKLADFEFDKLEIEAILFGTSAEPHLKVQEVAKLLSVNYETVSNWIETEKLVAYQSTRGGQKIRLVSLSSLTNFLLEYLPLSVLARNSGTHSKALLENMAARGIELPGSFEVKKGVRRGYLVPTSLLASC